MLTAILLVLVGFALVMAEIFFPSLGLLSVLATAAIVAADLIAFGESKTLGWILLAAELVLLPVVIWLAFRWLPRLPFTRRLLLQPPDPGPAAGVPDHAALVDRQGVALSVLGPSGVALIDGQRISVVALGGRIEPQAAIQVVAVEGSEIRVRPIVARPDRQENR